VIPTARKQWLTPRYILSMHTNSSKALSKTVNYYLQDPHLFIALPEAKAEIILSKT
jgi:hypothetical protein